MELDEVSELKSELERNLRLLSDFSERQKKVASVASTNSAITQSNNVINGETIQLFSPSSGIITFNVDQYEEIFTVGNIYNIDFDSIAHNSFEIENIKTNRITFGDRIYKVVDNSNWYAVTMIEQEDVHYYDENQMVKVKIGDKTVDGEISSIFPLNNKIVIAIKINDAVKDFYKERILEIGLLQDNYKGLKVYKSSIVKYNDIEGVFTINNLDKAEFKPVQVIAYDEEFAVIKGNYFYKMLNGDKERVNTVELFDKVLLEGEKYSEGDLID